MLSQAKIDLINSLDEKWPDVWGWLFLEEPLYEIIDFLNPIGISEQDVVGFKQHLESLELHALLRMAKEELRQDKPSPSLVVLRRRPGEEVLAEINQLLQSSDAIERELAMQILQDKRNECGISEFRSLIRDVLASERDANVIIAAMYALINLKFRDCIDLVIPFADHANQDVRQALAE